MLESPINYKYSIAEFMELAHAAAGEGHARNCQGNERGAEVRISLAVSLRRTGLNTTLLRDDPAMALARIKRTPGPDMTDEVELVCP